MTTTAKIEAPWQWADRREMLCRYSLSSLLALLFIFTPYSALADGCNGDPLCATLCTVVAWFAGNGGEGGGGLGRPIATLGIIVLGIGAMLGKVSWQMALITSVGMAIMVSGAKIVSLMTGYSNAESLCTGAAAVDIGKMADALCTVAGWAHSSTGKALGTLAVMILGVSALMGKVSAGLAILVGVGIAAVFGADEIAGQLMGSAAGAQWSC